MTILRSAREYDEKSIGDAGLLALLSAMQPSHPLKQNEDGTDRLRHVADRALRWRCAQRSIFPEAVLRETCWDIVLLCLNGELAGRQMCVKQIRVELGESQTSVLRRIDELEEAGMLQRQRDEMDGRRTLVRLTREGALALSRFFKLIEELSP